MSPVEMEQLIRSKINELRSLERIIQSPQFAQLYKVAHNKIEICKAIHEGDLQSVREWMEEAYDREICEYNIRQLRMLASQLGIKAYVSLTKEELLVQIIQVKHGTKANEFKQVKADVGRMPPSTNGTTALSH